MFEKPNETEESTVEEQRLDSANTEENKESVTEDQKAESTVSDDGFSEDLKKFESEKPEKKKKRLSKTQRTVITVISCVLAALILVSGSMYLFPAFYFANATAITVNGMKVPVYEYNFNYWTTVQYFKQSYGSYFDTDVLDTSKDLSKQQCPSSLSGDKVMTWQDYFLDQTDAYVETIIIAYQKALEQDFGLTEADRSAIDNFFDEAIKTNAESNKVSEEEFIHSMFGTSCSEKNLRYALEHIYIAQHYNDYLLNSFTVEQSELDSWMIEYKDQFWGAKYRYYGFAAASDSEADIAEAKNKAHEFLNKVTDQASFAALAYKTAADADKSNYESDSATLRFYFTADEISDADISNWLFDASRKPGDKEVVYSVTDGTAYALLFVDANYPPTLASNLYSIYFGIGEKYADQNAAQAAAQAVQAKFIESGKTADVFKGLAAQYSDDVDASKDGGLTSNFLPKNMDQDVAIWCYTTGRSLGEYSIIESSYGGYYFVYLDSWGDLVWRLTAIDDIKNYHYMQTQDETFANVNAETTFFKAFMVSK
ncbi:MAG TPA: peptidylprolyl isomerase [Oscillospiraceae bacterium]|nr:peptidylprolyl isomerase [Oscillospiraceae bacterium]HPS35456.1 peptidylprolyl isomerase [Oscillospiraceae bacterium]